MPKATRAERAAITRATRVVAEAYQLFRPLLFLPHRGGPKVAAARQISQYLAHCSGGVKKVRLAEAFRRDLSTIIHAVRLIEDMRDDPEFDRLMTTLETQFDGEN